ncbi:MAG: imidazoleglycerol-phosphate dehydratase HisB [Spirochaetales bacterium]|nr:imidazoleglycerol-phosphate dehydratase HisB [Spirochaetales bacterium]
MKQRKSQLTRKTKETHVTIEINLDKSDTIDIATGVPFFNHLLHAMAFHGNFGLKVKAEGDIDVDAHHIVEDLGLVLGEILCGLVTNSGSVMRFGHAVIPMDEALSEIAIDVCGRPTCVYDAEFPQTTVGAFDLLLLREFFFALANRAKISIHVRTRAGKNSHHMAESLFKALGKALSQAYTYNEKIKNISTKGTIS